MKYHESLVESQVILKKALAFLDKHQLAYNPIFYAVAYQHATDCNFLLSEAIKDAEKNDNIDPYMMEQLHREFVDVKNESDDKPLLSLGAAIDGLHESSQKSAEVVEKLDQELNAHKDNNSETIEISSVLNATAAIMAAQDDLHQQVVAAKKQSESIRAELEEAKLQAVTDPLTDLQNRQGLNRKFSELAVLSTESTLFTGILDLDHFKQFNDNFGHLVGDLILKRLARLLREELPFTAHPFRFGGEEFVVLVSASKVDEVLKLAEELRVKVEKLRFKSAKTKERLPQLTISIGLSQWNHGEMLEETLVRADEALYRAKKEGRNLVRFSYTEAKDD